MCVCMYTPFFHVCASDHKSQKRVSKFLDLKLQVVVIHLVWVLNTKLASSARTVTTDQSFQPWVFS